MPSTRRRVLITGVANFWGAELARRLLADPRVERVLGVDTEEPARDLERAGLELIRVDLRRPELARRLAPARAAGVDTVVHNDVLQFPGPGRSARQLHDVNVIGTLQLLAACEHLETLRGLVVRGSAAIYGAEPAAPLRFSEDMAGRYPPRSRFQRDLGELERLSEGFARRRPGVTCTLLRYQPVIGVRLDTPITRLVDLPAVPTFLGFDPAVQFLHEDDSVAALHAAVHRRVRGAVNVAGPGTLSLSRTLRLLGKRSIPVAHPLYGPLAGLAARIGGVEVSADTMRYLRWGRGVDTGRMTEELKFAPACSSLEAVRCAAADRATGGRPTSRALQVLT